MKKLIEFIKAYSRGEEAELSVTFQWYEVVGALLIGIVVLIGLVKIF